VVKMLLSVMLPLLLGLPVTQAAQAAAPAGPGPVLRYEPPVDFSRSPLSPPDDYDAVNIWPSASMQVYPFRPFTGDVQREFRQTLLRDWILSTRREGTVPTPPTFSSLQVPGAQAAVAARFSEGTSSVSKQRLRIMIVAKGMAALVDASAWDLDTWQRVEPALEATLASLHVEGGVAPPPARDARQAAAYRAVAGLYRSQPHGAEHGPRGRGGAAGTADYYLLSADGRAYRRRDLAPAEAQALGTLDLDAAERDDPRNSGRFTLRGRWLRMEFGSARDPELIVTEAPQRGRIVIDSVEYFLQD
jgi:hypothetical protein